MPDSRDIVVIAGVGSLLLGAGMIYVPLAFLLAGGLLLLAGSQM